MIRLKRGIRMVSRREKEFQLEKYTEVLRKNCETCMRVGCYETYVYGTVI